MTVAALVGMFMAPAVGIFVDTFRVKRTLFVTSLLLVGTMVFLLMFVPKMPSLGSAMSELKCDMQTSETVLAVDNGNIQQKASELDDNRSIVCEVNDINVLEECLKSVIFTLKTVYLINPLQNTQLSFSAVYLANIFFQVLRFVLSDSNTIYTKY